MAERKKPKPPVPGKPKPTPAKKKPAAQVPVTSVTPRSTVKKPSAKQVAGTRKVVANLAGATPIGRGVKLAKTGLGLSQTGRKMSGKYGKAIERKARKESGMSPGVSKGFDKAITKAGKFSNYGGGGFTRGNKNKIAVFHPAGFTFVKGSNKKFTPNSTRQVMQELGYGKSRNLKKNPSVNKASAAFNKVKSVKSVVKKKK